MIRTDIGESFVISVALWNEESGENASGQTVYYDVRDNNDDSLIPPVSGTLIESIVTSGIYTETLTLNIAGNYICYATASGFFSSSEEIIVNPENIYDLTKQYNVFVEDVTRTNITPTASQTVRNVPLGETDFIINKIKKSSESDWTTTTISGIAWAWYKSVTDALPYKMASEF